MKYIYMISFSAFIALMAFGITLCIGVFITWDINSVNEPIPLTIARTSAAIFFFIALMAAGQAEELINK